MLNPSFKLAELRSLVAAWNPCPRRKTGAVATGVSILDEALGGGLPAGQLTELVTDNGSGGQLVLSEFLATTRAHRQRLALIDAADSFSPEEIRPDCLRHLVWARCHELAEALSVADVLVRDGNYAGVVLDLRDVAEAGLNRLPKTNWHRLHRVAERQPAAVLVLTRHGVVPAVQYRLRLLPGLALADQRRPRPELLASLKVDWVRGAQAAERTG